MPPLLKRDDMEPLHYANAANRTDVDADDLHAYRFSPGAWRFGWLWWNVSLLVLIGVVVAVGAMGDQTLRDVLEAGKSDFLMYAPLTVALSVLVAHGKIDLSFPLQQLLALFLFGVLTNPEPLAPLTRPGPVPTPTTADIVQAGAIAVTATLGVGLLNWLMCSVLRASSALATLLLCSILLCGALAVVPNVAWLNWQSSGSLIDSGRALNVLWVELGVVLVLLCLATFWLLGGVRRDTKAQDRRQLGVELLAFLLVSLSSGVMGVLVMALPSVQGYGVSIGLQVLGMPQVAIVALGGVLAGGALLDAKLPNPIGALLGAAFMTACADFVAVWTSQTDMFLLMFVRGLLGHAPMAAAGLVVLLYTRRWIGLLRAGADPHAAVAYPSRIAWALAGLAILLWVASPLPWVYPDLFGNDSDMSRASRLILCMALLAASATYLLMILADTLMCRLLRARPLSPDLA